MSSVPSPSGRQDPRDHRHRARKQAKFRDAHVTMAHGAGGKAMQGLIEGLLVPALASAALDELADAGAVTAGGAPGADDGRLRRPAPALPGRLDRRPGGQRHGERPCGRRRAPAGPDALAGPRGGPPGGDAARRGRRRRGGGARGGVGSSRGTRRSSSAASPTGCTLHGRARPARRPRLAVAAALRPGDRILLSGPSASTARRSCSPAASSSSTRRSSPTRARCGRCRRAARRRGPEAALPARPDARRRRLRAQRARRASGVAIIVARPTCRSPGGRRGGGAARDRPDAHRERGQAGGGHAPEGAEAALAALVGAGRRVGRRDG